MKKILFICLSICFAVCCMAEEVVFKSQAPNQVIVGEPFRLTFSVNHRGKDLRAPEFTNFDVLAGPYTSTSSSTCFGHWFNASGNVCSYDSNARIFAEFYPDKYGCYVGQYPGRLTRGKTYTIRQAIIYKHTDGKEYRATMIVNLKVV